MQSTMSLSFAPLKPRDVALSLLCLLDRLRIANTATTPLPILSSLVSSSVSPSASTTTPYPGFDPSDAATPSAYVNRLDFISIIVICCIIALCFVICIIVGCRRKKRRRPPLDDAVDGRLVADGESRSVEVRHPVSQPVDRNGNVTATDGRNAESPPPTYSIIERQMSFTSYVSQTSSQFEIPPDYEDSWDASDGAESTGPRLRPGSRTSRTSSHHDPSTVSMLTDGGASTGATRARRSESATARGPPRVRAYRTGSDAAGRPRRTRRGNRPTTVEEDDGGLSQPSGLNSEVSSIVSGLQAPRQPRTTASRATAEPPDVVLDVEQPAAAHAARPASSSSSHRTRISSVAAAARASPAELTRSDGEKDGEGAHGEVGERQSRGAGAELGAKIHKLTLV